MNMKLAITAAAITALGIGLWADTHNKVQLWEGGPYWADTNIGAEKPWDSGYYFWWGDTVGYKRENDAWVASDGSSSNFQFNFGMTSRRTYNKTSAVLLREGWITTAGVLAPKHDAAHVHWGNGWRMPTYRELKDINSKCDWIRTTTNGVSGYIVRGRGDYASASIFLPAVGRGYGITLCSAGEYGYYWSSVPNSFNSSYTYELQFPSDHHSTNGFSRRSSGRSIRPVQEF